jgi:hypothetical protein
LIQCYPGAFKRLKHNFEEFPLLRNHRRSLAVIDAKKLVVEMSNVVLEKVSASSLSGCRLVLVSMVVVAMETGLWQRTGC